MESDLVPPDYMWGHLLLGVIFIKLVWFPNWFWIAPKLAPNTWILASSHAFQMILAPNSNFRLPENFSQPEEPESSGNSQNSLCSSHEAPEKETCTIKHLHTQHLNAETSACNLNVGLQRVRLYKPPFVATYFNCELWFSSTMLLVAKAQHRCLLCCVIHPSWMVARFELSVVIKLTLNLTLNLRLKSIINLNKVDRSW